MNEPKQFKAPAPAFKLFSAEKSSETWGKLRRHLQERQVMLLNQLASDQDERATAHLRGRILEVRYLLSLENDNPIPPPG